MGETTGRTLSPSAESIAALIDLIATSEWPKGEEAQSSYFDRLGFQQSGNHAKSVDSSSALRGDLLRADLAISAGSWMSYRGDLFAINLFLYDESSGKGTIARVGYDRIYALLIATYGPPLDKTNDASGRTSSLWKVSQTTVEMYCYLDPSPALQIGLNHTVRNEACEGHHGS